MILKKRMVISKFLGGPQPLLKANKPKNIHRFTISVKKYPRKCHDFVNQFKLTINYIIFSLLTIKILLHYCRNFPNGQPDFPNMLILKKLRGNPPPPNSPPSLRPWGRGKK
jgi:hypothetical protein